VPANRLSPALKRVVAVRSRPACGGARSVRLDRFLRRVVVGGSDGSRRAGALCGLQGMLVRGFMATSISVCAENPAGLSVGEDLALRGRFTRHDALRLCEPRRGGGTGRWRGPRFDDRRWQRIVEAEPGCNQSESHAIPRFTSTPQGVTLKALLLPGTETRGGLTTVVRMDVGSTGPDCCRIDRNGNRLVPRPRAERRTPKRHSTEPTTP
jgi:hypothetical protein